MIPPMARPYATIVSVSKLTAADSLEMHTQHD
jgi:hypothetical protein